MGIVYGAHSFYFHDDGIVHEKIQPVFPNVPFFVGDVDLDFGFCTEAAKTQFMYQGSLVYRFEEAGAEEFMNLHGGADDVKG